MNLILFFIIYQLEYYLASLINVNEVTIYSDHLDQCNRREFLNFSAFGKDISLRLLINDRFLGRNLTILDYNEASKYNERKPKIRSCHYIHRNSSSAASINFYKPGRIYGLIFLEDTTLEISPLKSPNRYQITRHRDSNPSLLKKSRSQVHDPSIIDPGTVLSLELALFLDAQAHRTFSGLFGPNSDSRLQDLLLAYVNNIQALYLHPSLGVQVDIHLVHLEIMKIQPEALLDLPGGERYRVLERFCEYSKSKNFPGDDDPRHWDLGLYLSGLDLYEVDKLGQRSDLTLGLSHVGGICIERDACAIVEFGVEDPEGRPYPSTGFTSVFVAAHEIGHNLGMDHDGASPDNSCPKDGYIMSASRGTRGESHWSPCSRSVAQKLPTTKPCLLDSPALDLRDRDQADPEKLMQLVVQERDAEVSPVLDHRARFGTSPGRHWDAKAQCELLFQDSGAAQLPRKLYVDVEFGAEMCRALRCQDPRDPGYFYSAGPALDGTWCDEGKECRAGECLPSIADT